MKLRTTHILSLMLLFALILPLQAKDFTKEEIKKNLPKMLGANNVGREFYFSFIPCWETPNAGNDLKLYISSGIRTKVVVEVVEKGYEKIKYTVPNDIIEYTLAPAIGQPYRKTDRDLPEPDQVWRGAGIHVVSDDPIICYGVTRYQYTSDAFLCIPVPALGKEYIVASFADPADGRFQFLSSYTSITAAYDKTKVRFTMGGTDWSKTAGGLSPGETSVWNLNKGDVLLVAGLGSHAEITGSIVVATKPVGVVSGNFCAYIPTNCGCCDVIEEMELPTNTWGTQYHVTKIIDRRKNSVIKIFAKEAKTKIYRDHNQIGFLRNAGGTEGPGYIYMRADEGAPRPIVVGGDKPISVTQYNTGQGDDGVSSDPFQLVLTPIEQYQREIIFNTPGIRGGYGFPKNYLNLCYEATQFGTIPDDLFFANVIGGEFNWIPLKDMSPQPGDPFVKIKNGKIYYSKTIVLPGDGVYKIKGSTPFAAYSYGFSDYDSYGMPTSVALGDLTRVDTLPPIPEWYIECNGNVNFLNNKPGYVTDKPDDELNRSNMSTIYMHSDLSYNYKLYNNDFMPCEDQVANWKLEVVDNSEDALAVVTFADCAGNDTTLVIPYNAVKLRIIPKEFDLGRHSVGEKSEKMFYIFNASETSAADVNFLYLKLKDQKGQPQGFTLWDSTGANPIPTEFVPPITIQPLDSFPFLVKFEATVEGEFWDSIGVGDTCNFWYKSIATANVGMPIIDVSDYNFPPTMVGSPAYGNFDVKNLGTVNLEITEYYGPFITGLVSNNKIYKSVDLEEKAITPATPLVLRPNETASLQVMFIPDDELSYPDSIMFVSNTIKDEALNKNNPIDSVCLLTGIGIRSDLQANGYNWGRKRIHRPGTFDIPPYPVVVDGTVTTDSVIRIYNGATAAVTITGLKNAANSQGDITAFKFNRADLLVTLQPGDTKIVPVEFQPTTTGQHLLTIEYTTNPNIPNVTSTLQGIGIVPRIETADVDFGATIMNDFNNPQTRQVRVRNLSNTDWQYGDSVTITDFTELNIHTEIINNWDGYGEPFRYDKDPLNIPFPIVLQPGEERVFDAEFVAKSGNIATASLTTLSDAEADVTSNWTGDGLLQSGSITGDQTTICVGMTDLLDVVLSNTNETDLLIGVPTITGADATKFKFVPDITVPFTLQANTQLPLKVQYTANTRGTHTVDVTFKTSALNADSVLTVTLTGNAVDYTRTFKVEPPDNGTANNVPIGIDEFTEKKIVFDPVMRNGDFSLSQLTGFIVNIKFEGDFLKTTFNPKDKDVDLDKDGIMLGNIFNDYPANAFSYKILSKNEQTGSLTIEIYRDSASFPNVYFISPNAGDLLTVSLHTYLPKKDTNQSDFEVDISPVEASGQCIIIPSATASLSIDRTCVYDIRRIIISTGAFGLSAIKPNPVTGNEAVIEFSIANTDCQTRIEVYNSANQLVAVPVDKTMQPGRYEVTVPVTDWASGSYYYIMKAGTYEEQQRMVIVK